MTISEKKNFVTSNRLCFNCLSSSRKTCQKKHHTTFQGNSNQFNPHLVATIEALQINRTGSITVFPTANVKVRSHYGRIHHLRALVDNCAQTNVITLQAMHRLDIKLTKAPDRINGVNQKNAMSSHCRLNLTIRPKSGNK